jgi:hypothetical protein
LSSMLLFARDAFHSRCTNDSHTTRKRVLEFH